MGYITYAEYQDMGGALDETSFQDLEYDAESTINFFTFNRLKRPQWANVLTSYELKRCMYQLIRWKQIESEMLATSTGGIGFGTSWKKEAGITSQSNDGVSTSYNVLSSGEIMTLFNGAKTKQELIDRYLGSIVNDLGQSILYRGYYPGE